MELIEVRQYDERHSYGVDWVTEYRCKSDSEISIKEAEEQLEKLGHKLYGELTLTYNKDTKDLIVKAVMY